MKPTIEQNQIQEIVREVIRKMIFVNVKQVCGAVGKDVTIALYDRPFGKDVDDARMRVVSVQLTDLEMADFTCVTLHIEEMVRELFATTFTQ